MGELLNHTNSLKLRTDVSNNHLIFADELHHKKKSTLFPSLSGREARKLRRVRQTGVSCEGCKYFIVSTASQQVSEKRQGAGAMYQMCRSRLRNASTHDGAE